MKKVTIDKLCCPFDKGDLDLQVFKKSVEHEILEGLFTCHECGRYYPILKGVPIMSPDEYRETELEKPLINSWQKHLPDKEFENFRLKN